MAMRASRILRELEKLKLEFGEHAGPRKRELLAQLEKANLPTATAVLKLHELLCFWRAYPDDAVLLTRIERMLQVYADRADLRRHRRRLADTGVAGTEIRFEFYARMAQWLAECWPRRLTIDWTAYGEGERLGKVLHLLALYGETPGLDEYDYPVREWIDRLRAPTETDATFLVRRIAGLPLDGFFHEKFYEDLALPLRLAPAPAGPSRTGAKVSGVPVIYQTGPLRRDRPDLGQELRRPPLAIRTVSTARARRLIDLAREAMVTRSRDLDVFAWADPRDVRLADCGDGLQFAIIGAIPERRLMLEAVYGFMTLKNGVPVGYALNSALFGSAEVAYNIFATYRGAEAGTIFGRLLATVAAVFGSDTFAIYPYQLGDQNDEALQSGAWWFYHKVGFRPRDRETLDLMHRELRRMRKNPRYRSSISNLARLARVNVYYQRGKQREDVIGELPLAAVGLKITRYLARRFGADRHRAERICAHEAAKRLGMSSLADLGPGERLAWRRWSPLLLILPGIEHWSLPERKGLVDVVRAKGGQRESDFAVKFDSHRRLRSAVRKLARDPVA